MTSRAWFPAYSTLLCKHWTQAPLARTGDAYKTVVAPWMLLPGKSLSVRTSVADRSGNSVDQTVLDLVPVR